MTEIQEQEREQNQFMELKQMKFMNASVVRKCMSYLFHFFVQMAAVGLGFMGCKFVLYNTSLLIFDKILFWEAIVAFVIGTICSHAYNYIPKNELNPLRDMARKKQSIWLHSNFAWKTISIWMTVTSLYCTGATVYIGGSAIKEVWAQQRIIVYSIVSSVMSMGMLVLRPTNRSDGYREAYLIITEALINYDDNSQKEIKEALIKGERIIARQDTMAPN